MNEKDIQRDRPQDPHGDGRDLIFETMEHGGEVPDNFPNAIRVKDKEGRCCIYVPIRTKKGTFAKIRDELNELFANGSTRPVQ
ncbi:hypothetical protein [Phyllobacterium sp. K27]